MIDLRPDHLEIVRDLLRQHVPECEVRAFGSRFKWTAKQASDLDLAVVGTKRLPAKKILRLKEAFEESILPMRVDVLDWHAITPEFQRVIDAGFEVIQEGGEVSPLASASSPSAAVSSATPLNIFDCDRYQVTKLKDISVKITKGTTPTTLGMPFVSKGVNFIKSESIGADGRINPNTFAFIELSTHNKLARSQIQQDDILFSMAGVYLGKTAIVESSHVPANTNQAVGIIRIDQSVAVPRYVHFALSNPALKQYVLNSSAQSAQPNYNLAEIGSLSIPLPSLPIQKAIAKILGSLDDRIDLFRRTNETLESIARALFKDWFIDFGPVRAKQKGRDPYLSADVWSLFPDRLVDSEVGEIPEGWNTSTIGEEVRAVGGGTPSTTDPVFWDNGIHYWATPKDLSKLQFPVILETERKITDAGLAKISSSLLPAGTLLLSSRAPIGYLAITEAPMAINQGFIAMICNKRISNIFAYFWCKENMERIVGNANGSTFQEISKSNFRPLPMLVPSEKILTEFSSSVRDIHQRIVANQIQINSLSIVRDALLPKFLSGELSVEGADVA